jgi:TRAP-type transport system small permease protein
MSTIAKVARSSLDFYHRLLKFLLTSLMGLMIVPVSLQVLSRYWGILPRYIWTEEAARFCFVWIVMIGSMIAVRDDTHFRVDLFARPKSARWEGGSNLVAHLAMLLMALVFSWYGYEFAKFGFMQKSEMSGINMLSIYVSFPLAGATWTVFLLERLVVDLRTTYAGSGEPRT